MSQQPSCFCLSLDEVSPEPFLSLARDNPQPPDGYPSAACPTALSALTDIPHARFLYTGTSLRPPYPLT